jgi:hypothetical protein
LSLTHPSPEKKRGTPGSALVGSTVIVPVGGGSPADAGEPATIARTSNPAAIAAVVRAHGQLGQDDWVVVED